MFSAYPDANVHRSPLGVTRLFLACLITSLFVAGARAEPVIETMKLNEVTRGTLLFESESPGDYQPAPVQNTDVSISVHGPVARAVVRQQFSNPGTAWVHALYAFPLPDDAAVDHLRMQVGERIIKGEIKPREAARTIHEEAKKTGKRSALVEQHRPDLFTTAVANIPPGGEVIVEIEYQQSLQWRDDQFSLRFPLATTPRFQPATLRLEQSLDLNGWSVLPGELPNRVDIAPVSSEGADALNPVDIRVELDSGFPLSRIDSPYHAITERVEERVRHIQLANGPVPADRDFVLNWSPQVGKAPQAAFFTEKTAHGEFGLLMVMPPGRAFQSDSPQPRESIYIIDSSGSMGGKSMREAKAALHRAIDRLSPGDRFNIIDFDDRSNALFSAPVAVSAQSRAQASHFVDRLQAGGGTQMLEALRLAFAQPISHDGYLRQIVFITDGAIANEKALFATIHEGLGDARLFTVGIGSAPNSYFMTRAAEFGRGSYRFIGNLDEVDTQMDALLRQIAHPALTDLGLELPVESESLPDPLPDLYLGEPISVVMKLDGIPDRARLTGRIGPVAWSNDIALSGGSDQAGLGVLWARSKIRHWMNQRSRGESEERVRHEVTQLAMKNHLVSRYTSLVAVDPMPVRPVGETAEAHALESNLPNGLRAPGSMQTGFAAGSTPSLLLMLSSLPFMLLGLVALGWGRLMKWLPRSGRA